MTTNGPAGPRPGWYGRLAGAASRRRRRVMSRSLSAGSRAFSQEPQEDRVRLYGRERVQDRPSRPGSRLRGAGRMSASLTASAPAIGLAMLGAVCFAGAAVLQHRAVAATTPVPATPAVRTPCFRCPD